MWIGEASDFFKRCPHFTKIRGNVSEFLMLCPLFMEGHPVPHIFMG